MPCIIESGFNPSPFQALQPEFLYAPDAQVLYADTGRTVARPSVVHTYWQTRAWARFFSFERNGRAHAVDGSGRKRLHFIAKHRELAELPAIVECDGGGAIGRAKQSEYAREMDFDRAFADIKRPRNHFVGIAHMD